MGLFFGPLGQFLMISWRQKRCTTSVRWFWRLYQAISSHMDPFQTKSLQKYFPSTVGSRLLTQWRFTPWCLRKRMLSCPALRERLLGSDWASSGVLEDRDMLTCFLFVPLMFRVSLVILLHSNCSFYFKAAIFDRRMLGMHWKGALDFGGFIFRKCQLCG